jgi:uncharacterized repeat protein (TIGR02543 family)
MVVRIDVRQSLMALLWAAAALLSSCGIPFVWNADVRTFVDDGLSVVQLKDFTAESGGTALTVIPSLAATVVTLNVINPRELDINCSITCADDSLYDVLPAVTSCDPHCVTFTFTPSLKAEHQDLALTATFGAPALNRTYASVSLTVHCNTAPGSVAPTLDAALDASGVAFAAFRLPCGASDTDLSEVDLGWTRSDGSGGGGSVTLPVNDPSLLTTILAADGSDLLGSGSPLNRYYRPAGISSGENYDFTVVVIDSEGLRSPSARITSSSATYSVTYVDTLHTSGTPPVDPASYRHTKPVTVLGQGTLLRTGYTFAGWNTAPDGSGTAYAPLDTFAMGMADVTLYGQWSQIMCTVTFDSQGGSAVAAQVLPYGSLVTEPSAPISAGFSFQGWYREPACVTPWSFGSDVVTAGIILYARWVQTNSIDITFTMNPAYGTITFSPTTVSVARGTLLSMTPSAGSAVNWHWYRDNVLDGSQTGSTYTWDTAVAQPGEYIVSVDAMDGGNPCTGSIRVTVTY